MPSSLPVPSKGALRTLRNLALGTSCTVAFSTGLLTEDRRRRIRAAQEVHDNAKRLKASRSYHSAGSHAIADTFEEQAMRYKDHEFLQKEGIHGERFPPLCPAKETSRISHEQSGQNMTGNKDKGSRWGEEVEIQKSSLPLDPGTPIWNPHMPPIQRHAPSIRKYNAFDPAPLKPSPILPESLNLKPAKARFSSRSRRLAADVNSLLEGLQDSGTVNAAAGRFIEAFEDGLESSDGIGKPLIEVAARLSKACWSRSNFDACEKILDIVTSHGPIDEAVFNSFHPFEIIEYLLQGPLDDNNIVKIDQANLRRAATIFLTKFKEKPGTLSEYGMELGTRLCAATCRAGIASLTIKLYWRLARSSSGSGHINAVQYLIAAEHQEGNHKKVLKEFSRFFTQTSPEQKELYIVGNNAMDSALTLQRLDKAEKVLVSASKMADAGGLVASTTWMLKLLGHYWRSSRDITGTRALFDRHESLVRLTAHPQAAYSAIIQFCVEAGDEAAAIVYQTRFEELYGPQRPDLRTCGHFALAKAMRQDWPGVEEDFRRMAVFATKDDDEVYTSVFLPILLIFTKYHPTSEIEEFLRLFTEQFKVPLNIFISNAMVDAYAKNREIGSISRWLQYAASVIPSVNAVTLNIIISNCHRIWGFSFDECYCLYKSVRDIPEGRGQFLVDQTTISILRDIALAESNGHSGYDTARKLKLLNSIPIATYSTDSRGIRQKMAEALANNNPGKALRTCERALHDHIRLDPEALVTATEASLQLHGRNLKPTAELLMKAQRNRQQIVPALASVFIFQISERAADPLLENMDILRLLNNMAVSLKDRNFVVPAAATHAAHILVGRGLYREAIDLWTNMSRRQGLALTSIDLVTMTVLLQAYIGLQDSVGIRWVSKTMSSNNLIPDMVFVRRLKYACAQARNRIQAIKGTIDADCLSMRELCIFHEALDSALDIALSLRRSRWEEKENVRFKTLRIMQDALEAQSVREPGCEAFTTKSSEANTLVETSPSSVRRGDDLLKTGKYLADEPDYGKCISQPNLVGLVAS